MIHKNVIAVYFSNYVCTKNYMRTGERCRYDFYLSVYGEDHPLVNIILVPYEQ